MSRRPIDWRRVWELFLDLLTLVLGGLVAYLIWGIVWQQK